jgi:hypothetical protein
MDSSIVVTSAMHLNDLPPYNIFKEDEDQK